MRQKRRRIRFWWKCFPVAVNVSAFDGGVECENIKNPAEPTRRATTKTDTAGSECRIGYIVSRNHSFCKNFCEIYENMKNAPSFLKVRFSVWLWSKIFKLFLPKLDGNCIISQNQRFCKIFCEIYEKEKCTPMSEGALL